MCHFISEDILLPPFTREETEAPGGVVYPPYRAMNSDCHQVLLTPSTGTRVCERAHVHTHTWAWEHTLLAEKLAPLPASARVCVNPQLRPPYLLGQQSDNEPAAQAGNRSRFTEYLST